MVRLILFSSVSIYYRVLIRDKVVSPKFSRFLFSFDQHSNSSDPPPPPLFAPFLLACFSLSTFPPFLSAAPLTFLYPNWTDNNKKLPYLDYVRHLGCRSSPETTVHGHHFLEPVYHLLSYLLHCPLLRPGFYEIFRRSLSPRFPLLLRITARAMGDRPAAPLLLFLLYGRSFPSAPWASLDLNIGCGADVHLAPHSCQRASPSRAGMIDEPHHRVSSRFPGRHSCSPYLQLSPPSSAYSLIGWGDSHV